MLAEVGDDLPERAKPRIEVEDAQNRIPHGAVRIFDPPAIGGTDVADRGWAHRLPALGFRELGVPHPTGSLPVFVGPERSCDVQPQGGGQVARSGIVDRAVRVDQCACILGALEEAGDIRTLTAQAGKVLDKDDAYLVAVHQREQLEVTRSPGSRRGGDAEIRIDNTNLGGGPPKAQSDIHEISLRGGRTRVVPHLLE